MEAPRSLPALEELKRKLLVQVERPEPSLLIVQSLVEQLQSRWMPPAAPEELAMGLDGLWQLRYTSAVALSRLGLDALPGAERTRTYQCIEAATNRLYNLAELNLLGGLGRATILVSARVRLAAVPRVYVDFERTALVWGGISDYGTAEGAIRRLASGDGTGLRLDISSEGSLDTLYLDADLRIGLGNRGSLFVLSRA